MSKIEVQIGVDVGNMRVVYAGDMGFSWVGDAVQMDGELVVVLVQRFEPSKRASVQLYPGLAPLCQPSHFSFAPAAVDFFSSTTAASANHRQLHTTLDSAGDTRDGPE